MATITTFSNVSNLEWFDIAESSFGLVTDTIELDNPVNFNLPHCYIGVQQFNISADPVLATAGTYQVFIRTINTEVFEELCDSPIQGNDPRTLNFAANLSGIRVVPVGITGPAATYKIVISANGN